MRETDTELHLARLRTELLTRLGGPITEGEIHCALQQALIDLKGSVSLDSLPEMASRLTAARLGTHSVLTPA